ncbi:unnamed protein product [Linum tenue]|uniref:ACT domain-containing protein n=1 Tax=Linum tenue TaxID=586396 RepID=A0AAV0IHD2_9ROSI|nr:unnamed protein product [Linum tenue]
MRALMATISPIASASLPSLSLSPSSSPSPAFLVFKPAYPVLSFNSNNSVPRRNNFLAAAAANADSAALSSSSSPPPNPPPRSKVRRHTISVFVGDESGMINRIAGVFARRGYNIESLAVGLNKDKALFTIVVSGTERVLQQVVEQLQKLVNVLKVRDLTSSPFAERELMLIKIAVNAAARRDVLDIATIFRAKAVDVSDHTITLELTGDLDKMVALQRLLEPFGICEVARTGRIALVRESGVDSKYLRGYSYPI